MCTNKIHLLLIHFIIVRGNRQWKCLSLFSFYQSIPRLLFNTFQFKPISLNESNYQLEERHEIVCLKQIKSCRLMVLTEYMLPYTVTGSPGFSPRRLIVNFEIWHGGLFEGGLIRVEGAYQKGLYFTWGLILYDVFFACYNYFRVGNIH